MVIAQSAQPSLAAVVPAVALTGSQQKADDQQAEHDRDDPLAFDRREDRDGERAKRRAEGEDEVRHVLQLG